MIKLVYKMAKANFHSQPAYLDWLKADLSDCDSIVELGCGSNSPILKIGYGPKTDAIDVWGPYIEKHNHNHDYRSCRQANILNLDGTWPVKQYDAVVICDVMEHLPKDRVIKIDLFKKMELCARKKVIIFTPNGFVENDEVDGDPWQRHVSAWTPDDYRKRGYSVRGADGFRWLYGKAGVIKYRPRTFLEYFGQLSQPLVYYCPALAWHSYAVKKVNDK